MSDWAAEIENTPLLTTASSEFVQSKGYPGGHDVELPGAKLDAKGNSSQQGFLLRRP